MVMGALRLPMVFTGAPGAASAAARLCAGVEDFAEVGVVVCPLLVGAKTAKAIRTAVAH